MLRKLVASVCLLLSTNVLALDLEPYVFAKVQAGHEFSKTIDYPSASGLVELGITVKEYPNLAVSYQYFKMIEPIGIDLQFLGVSYKFYHIWNK